jgi:2-iminoacetate synthase
MNPVIDSTAIFSTLKVPAMPDRDSVLEILSKARNLKGLTNEEVALLMNIEEPVLLDALFEAARRIKLNIYGKRLVIFAPLYISNLCDNECLYCAFRKDNKEIVRRFLSQEEIARETRTLIDQGHKRILLVAGESYPKEGLRYILKAIETIYKVKSGNGEIRRVNANIAPLTTDEFKALKSTGIGTYQLFQETYHPETYKAVHLKGKKTDYDWRISGLDRAIEAGIDDVGAGVLFGLYDWKYEVLALMQHIRHLEGRFGIGPHTISVPRLEPAVGSPFAENSPHRVSDADFMKLVAILRCAVPYTGIIMSTRETPEVRRQTFALGVSQISAGSRTDPGGYTGNGDSGECGGQFSLGDHRPLDEVIRDVASMGYIPSFCTACYRLGRTGGDFMELARPGDIRMYCDPNACATFAEYLEDYASQETRKSGYEFLEKAVNEMDSTQKSVAGNLLNQIKSGKRDCYC